MAITNGETKCAECGSSFIAWQYAQRFCSYKCGYTYRNRARQVAVDAIPRKVAACLRCGAGLSDKKSHAIYCSRTCKSMDHVVKHRGNTRLVNTPRRLLIFQRDGGCCYMCGTEVSLKEMHLDHLIPIAQGGTSDPFNLAVSCAWCNRSKGTRVSDVQHRKIAELAA